MSRPIYEHRQGSGLMLLLPLFFVGLGIGAAALARPERQAELAVALAVALPVLLATFVLFGALTIRIEREALTWRFGWLGWPHKSVALSEIARVDITRTGWLNGWGIHRTRRGWLYNVAGFDAVIVTLKSGRAILLGTDEPRRLAGAIERAIASK